MRYVKQFAIILIISFLGELLHYLVPLSVPSSIYGLVIMLLCLHLKVFPVSAVKDTSSFLIQIMPLFFVAPGVSVLQTVPVLKRYWWQLLLITIVSTFVVMIVTGHIAQFIMRIGKRGLGKQK